MNPNLLGICIVVSGVFSLIGVYIYDKQKYRRRNDKTN